MQYDYCEKGAECTPYALLKSDVTRRDHVFVVMDAGSRIVNFIVNFICITLKYNIGVHAQ